MSIHFAPGDRPETVVSTFRGTLMDADLLAAYREFYEGGAWIPHTKELVDLSGVTAMQVSNAGLLQLAEYMRAMLEAREIAQLHTAIYAPQDVAFGVSRVYEALADEDPESVAVFRDLDEARAWLDESE